MIDTSQRKHIAWCGDCGNVSVDGINFGCPGDAPVGWLKCAACGACGPFAYVREDTVAALLATLPELPDDDVDEDPA